MGYIESKGKTASNFTEKNTDFTTGQAMQKSSKEHIGNIVSDAQHDTAEITTWSTEETKAFLTVAHDDGHSLIFKLALYTGMRQKELLGLIWDNIDTDSGVIIVNGQHEDTTARKHNSTRQIPIPEFILNELLEHKKKQNEWKNLAGELYQEEDLVFCTNTGSVLTPGIVNRELKQIIKEAKVKEIRFSDLRYNPLSGKVDLFEISSLLSTPNPTLEYYRHMATRLSRSSDDKF